MKKRQLLFLAVTICIMPLLSVDLAYGRWPTIDPFAEKYYSKSPYIYANNNPVRYIDPDGRDFTPAAQEWVNNLADGIFQKVMSNMTGMAANKLALDTFGPVMSEGAKENLTNQNANMQAQNKELVKAAVELVMMATSNQTYDLRIDDELGDGSGTQGGAAFNFENGNFDIILPSQANIALAAHEFHHGFQFEIGTFSTGRKGESFYDQSDEVAAYERGMLFGGPRMSQSGVSYNHLPKGPISATNHPNISHVLKLSPSKQSSILQKMAVGSGSAFRANGKTYYNPEQKNNYK